MTATQYGQKAYHRVCTSVVACGGHTYVQYVLVPVSAVSGTSDVTDIDVQRRMLLLPVPVGGVNGSVP